MVHEFSKISTFTYEAKGIVDKKMSFFGFVYVLGDKVMVKKKPITDNCIGISMLWQNSLWPNISQSVRKKRDAKMNWAVLFFVLVPLKGQRA